MLYKPISSLPRTHISCDCYRADIFVLFHVRLPRSRPIGSSTITVGFKVLGSPTDRIRLLNGGGSERRETSKQLRPKCGDELQVECQSGLFSFRNVLLGFVIF